MLILTRKKGESLIIGDNIEINIMEVSGDSVKIGIEAPKSVKVLRSELVTTVEQNKMAASAKVDKNLLEILANKNGKFMRRAKDAGDYSDKDDTKS